MEIDALGDPELSRRGEQETSEVRARVRTSLGRVAFLTFPSAVAYLVLGDVLIAALLQRGRFGPADTMIVYVVLAAYSLGLVASSSARVLSSTFYALRDTRTPALLATVRVTVSALLGLALMFPLDRIVIGADLVGPDDPAPRLGAVGLGLGASVGAWLEYALLRRRLGRILGPHGPGVRHAAALGLAGVAGVAAAVLAKLALGSSVPLRAAWIEAWLGPSSPFTSPLVGLGTALAFGVAYLAAAAALGVGVPWRRLLRR